MWREGVVRLVADSNPFLNRDCSGEGMPYKILPLPVNTIIELENLLLGIAEVDIFAS